MVHRYMLALLAIIGVSCSQRTTETLWINSYLVPCQGVAGDSCLLVSKSEGGSWENWPGEIEGFTSEQGMIYELEVEERIDTNVSADASSIEYVLVNVNWKKPDPIFQLNGQWLLIAVREESFETHEGGSIPRLNIMVPDKSLSGNAFCNQMNGSLSILSEEDMEFGPIATTRMICPDQDLEDTYLQLLAKVKQYAVVKPTLVFYDQEGTELLRYAK